MPEADRTSGIKPDVNNDAGELLVGSHLYSRSSAERAPEVKVASINCAGKYLSIIMWTRSHGRQNAGVSSSSATGRYLVLAVSVGNVLNFVLTR